MALATCPECGHQVSTTAASCPNCGYVPAAAHGHGHPAAAPYAPRVTHAHPVPGQKDSHAGWVLVAKLAGGLLIFVLLYRQAQASALVGSIIILGGVLVGVGTLAGSYAAAVPAPIKNASQWLLGRPLWLAATVGILVGSGAIGVSARRSAVAGCERAMEHARSSRDQKGAAAEVDGAFNEALSSCGDANLDSEVQAIHIERHAAAKAFQAENAAEAERQAAARKAEQGRVLEKARTDSEAGKHAQAVAEFANAAKLGDIPPPDKSKYARSLREQGKTMLEAKEYADAVAALTMAKKVDPKIDGVDDALTAATKQKRNADVKGWIDESIAISRDKARCDTPEKISGAWQSLRTVTKQDALYHQAAMAAAALERCRKTTIATLAKGVRELMQTQRQQQADEYERALLNEAIDARVTVGGVNKEQLTIKYVLLNRAWAYKITDGGDTKAGSFLGKWEKIGFKRVTFSDGFGESYYYDLNPQPDDGTVTEKGFADIGLDQPLKLN